MSQRILVLPGGMPASLRFAENCKRLGLDCVGASSLLGDQASQHYERWAYIPAITDDGFGPALSQVLIEHGVDRIFAPHSVVWRYLSQHLARIAPAVALVSPSPLDMEMLPYRTARQWAVEEVPLNIATTVLRERPTLAQRQAYWHHVERVPGMCDNSKLSAMLSIVESAPPGDIVEIGSWWGRSAVAFALLNQSARLGALICVDPWASDAIVQNDSPAILNETSNSADFDEAFAVFCCNLLPYASAPTNYVRACSVDAAVRYQQGRISSLEFGDTVLKREISILHIDGNHDHDAVAADIRAWAPYLRQGSWIIFDDYVWPFGSGPRRVADQYVEAHAARINCAFACGSALFVQLS